MPWGVDWAMLGLGCVLLLAAAVLVSNHLRNRPRGDASSDAIEQEFLRRQFRRRMQSSMMVGVVALLLCAGSLPLGPWWNIANGVLLLALIAWILLLALADLTATRHHFQQVQLGHLMDELRQAPDGAQEARGGADRNGTAE